MAGGRRFTLGMSLSDVLRARHPALSRRLGDEISEAIEAQRFGAIVVDNTGGFFGGVFDDALWRCYEPQAPLFDRDDVFWPVTGTEPGSRAGSGALTPQPCLRSPPHQAARPCYNAWRSAA
jgi:hypothetical protein